MELNLNVPVTDLDGVAIPESNVGKTIAQTLAFARDGDALKLFDIALKFQKGETVNLDTSDSTMLKERIKADASLTNLVKAQALQLFK